MKTTTVETESITIEGAPALDPVTVIFITPAPGHGRIIVECYGKAWAAYWGAIGEDNIKEFVADCEPEYVAGKLWRDGEKRTKQTEAYLLRIVYAIQSALKSP